MSTSYGDKVTTKSREQPVSIESHQLTLEGVLILTEKVNQPGLALCHPHPLFGGSMDDSRLIAIQQAAVAKGFNTLRFNYRGVGKSQGQFGQGIGEIQDTIAAVKFLRNHPHTDSTRISLLGYSFGGSMSLAAAMDVTPAALVTISAPLRLPDLEPGLVKTQFAMSHVPPMWCMDKTMTLSTWLKLKQSMPYYRWKRSTFVSSKEQIISGHVVLTISFP